MALDKALAGTGLKADQHGLALLDRARAAEAQGDLKTARAKIDEAAKTIGEDPYLWYFSAAISLREENIPAAKSAINRALAMVPDSAEVLFEESRVRNPSSGKEIRGGAMPAPLLNILKAGGIDPPQDAPEAADAAIPMQEASGDDGHRG